ncbi:hypothetical protein Ccrd_025183 [Cynara cardunculus var. scolymus]|uniref:Uncharacterized protein n=1 Tax=Cynara cardunculus var. scolymus TaxID=59895 RepID=A0A103XB97_CYNCS|nr:hypothetical protein Ccrd_025183 [Cynara cardunculus var. scolymus]
MGKTPYESFFHKKMRNAWLYILEPPSNPGKHVTMFMHSCVVGEYLFHDEKVCVLRDDSASNTLSSLSSNEEVIEDFPLVEWITMERGKSITNLKIRYAGEQIQQGKLSAMIRRKETEWKIDDFSQITIERGRSITNLNTLCRRTNQQGKTKGKIDDFFSQAVGRIKSVQRGRPRKSPKGSVFSFTPDSKKRRGRALQMSGTDTTSSNARRPLEDTRDQSMS